MSKQPISYETFTRAATELQADGRSVSMRSVRDQLGGGSYSTLLPHLRRWNAEMAAAAQVNTEVSGELLQSLKAEIARFVETAVSQCRAELSQERQQAKELSEVLAVAETKNTELEQQLTAGRDEIVRTQHELSTLKARLVKMTTQLQQLIRANAQAEAALATLPKLEHQHDQLKQQLVHADKAQHDAEVRAAVAEARLAEIAKHTKRVS